MKLTKVRIRDFQKHRNLILEVDPDVTIISGDTDRGKSAALRAIRWCCLNKPDGRSFIRRGRSKAIVTATFGSSGSVTRIKSRGNTYKLVTPQHKRNYHAFRNDIPELIQNLLQVSELNFQTQHEAPFWLSDSKSEVSRKLNEIVDLGIIDSTLSELGSRLREQRVRLKVHEEDIQTHKQEYKRLRKAKTLDEDLRKLERLDSDTIETSKAVTTLTELLHTLSVNMRAHKQARTFVEDASPLLSLSQSAEECGKQKVVLDQCIKTIEQTTRKADFPKLCADEFRMLEKVHIEREEAEERFTTLEFSVSSLADVLVVASNREYAAKEVEKQFHKETKGQKCPLCGNIV